MGCCYNSILIGPWDRSVIHKDFIIECIIFFYSYLTYSYCDIDYNDDEDNDSTSFLLRKYFVDQISLYDSIIGQKCNMNNKHGVSSIIPKKNLFFEKEKCNVSSYRGYTK